MRAGGGLDRIPYSLLMGFLKALLRQPRHREQLLAYWILAATLGVMLATVWHSLNSQGVLAAWDAGGHLLKADYFAHHQLAGGHLSGWFPIWHGGFDLFQFYPPLLYYLLGPLTLLFEPELALRLVTAGLWLALVPVTYYFLRSFHLGRLMAAIGTSFLLALNASFGIGLGALYGVGLLPNGLGFVLAIWVLGRLKRDLAEPQRRKYQFVLTGLLFGMLILAHTFSAYWWILASLLLAVTEMYGGGNAGQRVTKRYGFVAVVGLLVSAYWWVPLALNLGEMGPTGAIQQSPRSEIFSGLILAKDSGGIVVSLLGAGGLLYLAARKLWRTLAFFGSLSLLSLLLSLNTINAILPFSSIVGSSQFIRFQAFFAWLLVVLAAFGVAGLWQLAKRLGWPVAHVGFGILSATLFLFIVLPTLEEKRGFVTVVQNEPTREIDRLAGYLDGALRPGEFILTEFNWDSRFYFGSPHFVNQRLPQASDKIWDLNGNFPEGTLGATKPVLIASTLENASYFNAQREYLLSRGVRFVISTHPNSRVALRQIPWLREAWQGTVLTAFELRDYGSVFGLPPAAGAQVETVWFADPGRYEVKFRQPVPLPAGTSLALSYHPWLRVAVDGRPVASRADLENRLELPDAVSEVRSLTVEYRPALAARVASGITVAALLAIVVLLAKRGWLETLVDLTKRPRRTRSRAAARGRRPRVRERRR